MDQNEFDVMYRVEEKLWWYRGMRRISRMLIERYSTSRTGLRILDAGCGTGAGLGWLGSRLAVSRHIRSIEPT